MTVMDITTFRNKLIYIMRINDTTHKGCLKIGETICEENTPTNCLPNSEELNSAARKRINSYTQTAGIEYELLHTERASYKDGQIIKSFNDKQVHEVLLRSNIKKHIFDNKIHADEWFETDLNTAINAIKAVKEGKTALAGYEISKDISPIAFRNEQKEAITITVKKFKNKKQKSFLWNAKMRFGKTLCALQVVKELNIAKTIIITHRPVVDAGWYDDFSKIFFEKDTQYIYGSQNKGYKFSNLNQFNKRANKHYIYFASIQDLRDSKYIGGNYDKNENIFCNDWDLVIIDEAHEGTQTDLGQKVIQTLRKDKTNILHLSGTPFNLLNDFDKEDVYTWDYIMEQKAKNDWTINHYGDYNPYSVLPTMNILTFDLGENFKQYTEPDVSFNFKEFFRTYPNENKFVHQSDVQSFLDLITKKDDQSNYPFANDNYCNAFRHTLWIVTGVKEAKALEKLLNEHNIFGSGDFKIVNVAGEGGEDINPQDALSYLRKAIGKDPDQSRTITLSCGRLTTGVTVPEWTAVFMLAGSYSTSAASYMQTIFRVQSPAIINGRVKTNCYVFDFAPDRTLKILAQTVTIQQQYSDNNNSIDKALGEFLNFCPVISINGTSMQEYNVDLMLQQLKKVFVDQVVNKGFDDDYLYNKQLLNLNDKDLKEFKDLKAIIGSTKAMPKTNEIEINAQGLTDEEYSTENDIHDDKDNIIKPSPSKTLTEEEKQKQNKRKTAISILRGISIRMPLMIYGINLECETEEITLDNFADLIDTQSWKEFMPKGVTKEIFHSMKRFYDKDVFAAAAKKIRSLTKGADNMNIEDRIERITCIFANFRNPDKETILTPWRVVNMHLGDCIGGYNFFDENYSNPLVEPRFIDKENITSNIFNTDTHILEINSKTGLYPLYVTYSTYRQRKAEQKNQIITKEQELALWDKVVAENIFVICKTQMAKKITIRTLVGYREAKVNAHYFEDLINQIKNKPDNFLTKIAKGKTYWHTTDTNKMKFNAIIGNPPYQETDGGHGSSAKSIYGAFVSISKKIDPTYISLIIPSRWMQGGKGLDDFRDEMLNDKHISILHDYLNSKFIFNNVQIEGGVCYFLWNKQREEKCQYYSYDKNNDVSVTHRYLNENNTDIVIRNANAITILSKVKENTDKTFDSIVLPRNPFGVEGDFEKYIDTKSTKGLKILGRFNNKREVKNLISNYVVKKNKDIVPKWKVFISKADGAAGQIGNPIPAKIIGKTEIGEPNEICTETFLAITSLNSETEVQNVTKYTLTKFFRFMVGIRKLKNMTKDTFRFVPLQDFTNNSDIDWKQSVKEIDEQLYDKYNFTDDERKFINKMISNS